MSYADLSGIFYIQSNYLTGINTGDPSFNANVQTVQTQLDDLYTSFNAASISSNQSLTQQQNMLGIVNTEMDRLNEKKQSVDSALVSKQRAALLNTSYQQRYAQYTNVIIAIVFTLAIVFALNVAKQKLPFIPPFVIDILTIIASVMGILVVLYVVRDIMIRNKMYHDQYIHAAPVVPDATSTTTTTTVPVSTTAPPPDCSNASCCGTGSTWDLSSNTCIPNAAGFKNMDNVSNNSPYEFDSYVRYN
jgi:hypothetical protein